MDETQPCLKFTYNQPHEEESIYAPPARTWKCKRCGDTFSEATPTHMQGLRESCDSWQEDHGTVIVS